ncbi:hypothetical protein [uncultured Thiocystis sp.]|uniref:hypothetical protein n=1 Tax=uncultured Thiocystis sp. TaxID=1202134 RepID=UPI0025D7D7AD|nr:hypothetical protein [uncultured Thiocystis sp.]
MPTPLVNIATAIHKPTADHEPVRDYYHSPVEQVLEIETGEDPQNHLWPFVSKEDATNFPNALLDSEKSIPATEIQKHIKEKTASARSEGVICFYEIIMIALDKKHKIDDFQKKYEKYLVANKSENKDIAIFAKKQFFYAYGYLLSRRIRNLDVKFDKIDEASKNLFKTQFLPHEDSLVLSQYEYYVKHMYDFYLRERDGEKGEALGKKGLLGFAQRSFRNRERNEGRLKYDGEKNKRPYLYGPALLMRLISMSFNNEKLEINPIRPDNASNYIKTEQSTKPFDLGPHGGENETIAMFVFCMVVEHFLSQQDPVGQSASIIQHEITRIKRMPEYTELSDEKREAIKIMEAANKILLSRHGISGQRFMSSGFSSPLCNIEDTAVRDLLARSEFIEAEVIDQDTEDADSVYQRDTLHVWIPYDSANLEHVIEVRFFFFVVGNNVSEKLPFLSIGSYEDKDKNLRDCDGYYFVAERTAGFPEKYLHRDHLNLCVNTAYAYSLPDDQTTAHVIVLLEQ